MKKCMVVLLLMTSVILGGYSVGYSSQVKNLTVGSALRLLSSRTIFFAHQSVGRNILSGIDSLVTENGVSLNVTRFDGDLIISKSGLYHTQIGTNRNPKSKIDEFYSILKKAKIKPDVAFLKLCFVDVTEKTDVNALFSYYKQVFQRISEEFPGISIVHFTVPLKISGSSWKTKIKSFLGQDCWEFADNIKRNQFNHLLLAEYQGKEPVFDIAAVESTFGDGSRETFAQGGHDYLALFNGYSSDGGHLNSEGQRWVAEHLVIYLGTISQ